MISLVGGARATAKRHIAKPPAHSLNSYVEHIMTKCAVEDCEKNARRTDLCGMHYARKLRYGRLNLIRRENGAGSINKAGYVDVRENGRRTYQHIVVAEKALGRPLPDGAVVHHANENKKDNRPDNLVICPSEAYHQLLHRRMKAIAVCGNPDWRKCWVCQKYDEPSALKFRKNGKQCAHLACEQEKAKQRWEGIKSGKCL